MAVSLVLLNCILIFLLLHVGDCLQVKPDLCDSSCSGFPTSDLPYQKGVRYTYRYSTTITSTLHGSSVGRNGLALDCLVDIDVVSKCHLMMQIRNPQIKRLSPQKEHSVQHLKSLRESLERTRLKFSLQGGKVTALCLQEGEQVWALNIKKALLSMFQTSPLATKLKLENEVDVYGTCISRYERRGPVLLKTRDLKQCHQSRLANFWPHSVALSEDTSVHLELQCAQRHGSTVVEEVNCTEAVSMVTWSRTTGLVKTQTVSKLLLLRAQSGTPLGADSLGTGVPTDLQFEDEGAARLGKTRPTTPQEVGQTVRMLCSLTSDPQLVSQKFMQLVFQLKDLTVSQLKIVWQEASFKCRNDWQPLLDALPACGSENCIMLLTDLMRNKELEDEQTLSFLTTIALIPHPSPQIIGSINALMEIPELQPKALLAGSSLVYQLCRRSQNSCTELSQVQTFMQTLEKTLQAGCEGEKPTRVKEVFYALKSVGNTGVSASAFIPLLSRCVLSYSSALQLRLAAVHAFRRFPCSADRSVLLQLYSSSQEDTEVRIAAYQQLMRCPDQDVFEVVKTTLRSETSSQVGSFVWSHLTNVLRSEDPTKQALIESLPDNIVSRDFEAEFLKFSSYSDYTVASGIGVKNVETSLIFSPKSFLPRSASVNVTVYFHGRAHNLLEVDLHVENAEPFLKSIFGQQTERERTAQNGERGERRARRKMDDGHRGEKETCFSSTDSYLNRARAMLFGRKKMDENRPSCWVGVKVFGNELSVFTCEDLHNQINQVSLSMAGLAVKLLKGQEVQLNHRSVLMTEELALPSLSGLPVKLGINMTSLLSLHLKGNVNYRDYSHFSLTGYIKPNADVSLSVRMGVDSALGQAAVEWLAELRSATSLDGSIQLQEGQDFRVTLNTPEDLMDIFSLRSRLFQLSGDHREEIKGPKTRVQKTTCTPKSWSKMVGWQLCSNTSYPSLATGGAFPPFGPVHLSLRLLKLDRGLHYYLLEAAYSVHHQRGTWLPREASIHLLLATPQSSIPRDVSLDLAFSPRRLLLKIIHPLKNIHIQGELDQERNTKSGKLELLIDGVHFYIMGLVDTQTLLLEQRTRYHLEAKLAPDRHPIILSANITRGLGGKTSFSATVKNVFREPASLLVVLERRRDGSSKQYSVEAELLFPGVVGSRMLGLMEQRGSLWSSVLRLKYGLGVDARHLLQECYTSQRVRSERDSNLTYIMRADHEFYCTNTAPINHKIHLRHEESLSHIKSSLDMSYGKHWDEINNKHTLLLSQSFKNQSTENHTSYTLEFNLQAPEKNYRTQLLHSHLTQHGSERSTHLKINYNNLMPLVAGLHWKSPHKDALHKTWEGSFNMDTPWLYVYTAHKLNQLQSHTLQLTSELTASKSMTVRNLVLEGFYRDRGREKEARLELYTPAITYLQAGGWGFLGKRTVKASGSLSSLWTSPLRADVSLEASKFSHTLQMASTYGKQNVTLAAALNSADKNLKKRQAILKMTFSKPKGPPTEVELEGVVEELKKDKRMYKKTAMLQLRQPFQTFLPTLLLRETFTVDLLNGIYVLESKAGFSDNKEVIHTLTLGYQPPSPFVCSVLIHPFSTDTIPSDSEICVTITSNQNQRDIQGKLRVGSKERLTFSGQVQLKPTHSTHQAIKVKGSFFHQLQLQLPTSAIMEGDVLWTPNNNNDFDYQAKGKLRIERQECQLSVQLNGTSGKVGLYSSLRHPFKSKIPKTLEASADMSMVPGEGSSSVCVRADGKDRLKLNAQMSHFMQKGDRAVGLRLNLSQSLLPTTTDLHVNIAGNTSSDSVFLRGSFTQGMQVLLFQLKGSVKNSEGVQMAVTGDLRHTMTSIDFLPSVLGLDGALGQSDSLIEGQLRVRLMDTVYSAELRHQRDPGETLDGADEEGSTGKRSHGAHDWLCVWSGEEHLCVNVSRQLGNQGKGELYTQLSQSFHVLSATGIAPNSSAQVKWAQEGNGLSVLGELQVGREHFVAEFHGDRTDHPTPQWVFSSRLQHQVEALLKSGLPPSFDAKAHYQLETEGLDMGLSLHMEHVRVTEIILNVGPRNKTTILVVSLWQQMKLLQGLIPTSLQMNCTGDVTADRLSAHCYGNVADSPLEVRAFRSYRPHNRLCYGLSLAHFSLSAQAKGCYSSSGQKELRANLTHSSVRLFTYLGVPTTSGVRFLLRPGPERWVLEIGIMIGPWRTDLSMRLRLERPGQYRWHGFLEYGTRSVTQKATVMGRMRLERWCHILGDIRVVWDSLRSSLFASLQCTGVGRLYWRQVKSIEGGVSHKASLTVYAQGGKDGLKGSLSFQNRQDFLQGLMSVLLKNNKAELAWRLQHQWAYLETFIPNRVDCHGSGEFLDTSLAGSAQISVNARSAQMSIIAAWEPSTTSFRATLQQSLLATASVPQVLTVTMSTSASQAQFEMEIDACSMLLLASQHRGGRGRRIGWMLFVQQRCVLLKALLPPQTSFNISMTRSGCSTNLSTVLQAEGAHKGSLSLSLSCHPQLSLRASVQHSIEPIKKLQFPTHGALLLNVSTAPLPGVEVGLELGRCYLRGNLGKVKASQREVEQISYTANVTSFCPSLQGMKLPVSLALQGFLEVVPCQMIVSTYVRADNQSLSLKLSQSCRSPHLSGTLTHSFLWLSSEGLPQIITIDATAPKGLEQAGNLLIKVGTCQIRANRIIGTRGRTEWLLALESTCPMLQANINGSVWQDPQGIWTLMLNTDMEGKRGFLRLNARAWPELSVDGELNHDLPALRDLPKNTRLRLTSRSGNHRFDAEGLVQMEECAVTASGAVMSQPGLQGSLMYHNNCTVIQGLGSPDRMQASGSLIISTMVVESQVSMVIDNTRLQTLVLLNKTKDKNEATLNLNHSLPLLKKLSLPLNAAVTMNSGSHSNGSHFYTFNSKAGNQMLSQEMTVTKVSETVRVKNHFRHTVNYLRKLGVPANNSIQVEFGSAEGKAMTLQSQFGSQLAGLRLKMKNFPKEIRGSMWHSWSWLHDRGLPLNIEALCSIKGIFSQLQSRALLTVDGHKLLTSGLNFSGTDGHLAVLLSYSPPAFNQTRTQYNLDTFLTAQFKGPLRSASLDIRSQDWRVRAVGDVGGWGAHGGTKEARITLKHTVHGQAIPIFQVEAWGRLTESQLRCSMAVNPELSTSLALIVQGYHVPHSKDLMVKVVQNIPTMLVYLPSQLNVRSQLNQSESTAAGLLEVLSGRRRLWALGEVAAIESGYRQLLEVKHSYPQLKPLPRTVAVRTVYEAQKWSYQVQQAAVWGNQEFSLSGLYSAPPALEMGNQTIKVQITCIPRLTSLDVTLERSLHARLDSVLLDWMRHGQLEQVRALSSWSRTEEMNATKLELKQPFTSTLSQLSLHTLSQNSPGEQRSSHQAYLSWDGAVPANVSLNLNRQWQANSTRGQACALFSAQQMAVSSVKGCISMAHEGTIFSQNAELRWDSRSLKQSMKYQFQKGQQGMHSLQVNVGLDRVSPAPCPSHTLLAKVQTNLRDRLEHTVLLGLCPLYPTLSWSGSHRVNSGEELLYTQSRLSVTGRPYHCSFTLAIINASTAQGSNMSLFSESRMGNYSLEVRGRTLSQTRRSGVQLQATLDGREKIWLGGTVEGRCLQTTAGHMNGPGLSEDLTVAACVGVNHSLTLDVQKGSGSGTSETLGSVFLGTANQRLMLRASGCLESLTAAEERVNYLSSQIQRKLMERIKTLQRLLVDFRRQSRDSQLLQELSALPLHVSQQVEVLLGKKEKGMLALWQSNPLRHFLTDSLPRFLNLLQHASLQGQQELRRPLATLAGVYQDVKGQRLEVMWREAVMLWTDRLVEVLSALLENPQPRPLSQAGVTTLSIALNVAGQHTYHWIETRLATALSGVRKRLASVYRFSPSECSVTVSAPLPQLPWSRMTKAGLMEILLEEWILRPLQTLASIRPTAELYRLKRKIMDSPFTHQALLVADQFIVTFDGHLYELPGSCPLLLAQDVSPEPSFTLLLGTDAQDLLLIQMNNHTINIQRDGQVKADCSSAVSHIFHTDDGLAVRKASNVVQVSSQSGASVSCDLSLEVCSFTLDGWLHGVSTGLFGTNDNDAGNDFPLCDGSQAKNLEDFLDTWQMKPTCLKPSGTAENFSKAAVSPASCDFLFSSADSPLSSCFRVVDPGQFLSVCKSSSSSAPCRLAFAFVHLCQQNYVPLEVPIQCMKV